MMTLKRQGISHESNTRWQMTSKKKSFLPMARSGLFIFDAILKEACSPDATTQTTCCYKQCDKRNKHSLENPSVFHLPGANLQIGSTFKCHLLFPR